ncbi:hypothetical protein ACWCQ0_44355, partial [Streptomyces massasporeus]
AAVVEAEERVRRERELFDRQSGLERPSGLEREQEAEPGHHGEPEPVHQKEPAPDAEPDVLVTAQESRARRNAQPVRKVVRGKGGRPIVPPLGVPAQPTSGGERRGAEPADPEPRAGKGRRLSERARALADELTAERAQATPSAPTRPSIT